MKGIKVSLSIIIMIVIANNTFAQENVSKDVLLTTLNSVNSLNLSNLKTSELMEYNKGFVDKIYTIVDSDKSEKDKKSALEALSNDSEKDLTDLLGKKNYKKYVNLMGSSMKPLIKKSKILKNLY